MTVSTSPASGANSVTTGDNAQTPPAEELVPVTIDGVQVQVPKGSLIIRAAETIGVEIPRFCDHPLLEPVGACRQCLVEVATPGKDGSLSTMPKPQPACAMTVSAGMEVKTQQTSPKAEKAQRGVMELLLINHPLDCPVCDKGGECPLQNQALSHGQARSRFEDVKRTFPKPVAISTNVLLDRERCVLCQRCTRFSDQIAGDPFIALVERGAQQQIGIGQDEKFESYFSGNTVQICPVGALTGAAYRFRARPFDLVSTPSVCEHCASGCAQRVDHRRGVVLRRQAALDSEVNEEWNCDKGRWAFAYPTLPDRITTPLVRRDGVLEPASWPEALAAAADGLAAARSAGGVGVLTGGRLTSEDAYAYSKFARVVLGTNDIDFRARTASREEATFLASHVVATGPAPADATEAQRRDGAVSYRDLEQAKAVLLVGFEPEEESPMVFLRLRKANRKNKTAIASMSSRYTRSLRKLAARHIPAAPGTETELLHALREKRAEVAEVAATLDADAIILLGERVAEVPGAFTAAVALAQTTGARLAWIPRRAGERGALEAGCLPGLLPGGRPAENETARDDLAATWGVPSLPSAPGRDGEQIIADAASGQLAGLLIGAVTLSDLPNALTAVRALDKAFVVSLEQRSSTITERADVVLPVAAAAEKSGSYVDWEGRLRPFETALSSTALSDHRVLDMLADEMDAYLGLRTLDATAAEMRGLGPWRGDRQVPPNVGGRAVPTLRRGQAVLDSWHHLLDAGRLQHGEPFLAGTAPATRAHLSAQTAAEIGVAEGDLVTVSTQQGSISLPVAIAEEGEMVPGVVWVPTNSPGSTVHPTLGARAGDVVTLAAGGAR